MYHDVICSSNKMISNNRKQTLKIISRQLNLCITLCSLYSLYTLCITLFRATGLGSCSQTCKLTHWSRQGERHAVQPYRKPDSRIWWCRWPLRCGKASPCKSFSEIHFFNMQKMSILIGGQFCPWLSTLQSRWRPSKVIIIIIIIISIRFCNMRSSKNLGCGFVLQNWSYLLSQVGDTRRGGRLNTAWSLHPRSPPSLSHCWPRSHPGESIFAILTLTCQNCETSERKERC